MRVKAGRTAEELRRSGHHHSKWHTALRGLATTPAFSGRRSNRGANSLARDTYDLRGRPALRDPCRPNAAGCIKLSCLTQGKVIFAASTFRAGELAGTYAGATEEATIGVGLGANVLVGGSNQTVALQPVSVQGQAGVNLAIGFAELQLRSVH